MDKRANFSPAVREIENTWITLRDGTRLAARIWLPEDAGSVPVPAILEYLPYRKRDGTAVRDALTHPWLCAHGYACVRLDIRGNGDSDGIMYDEYLAQEQDDALEAIDWIAAQPWCSGSVGMMGISWGGFNALQVAARGPRALKAVIALCFTDDRYADDIHYRGGCLMGENLGWASTMFAYSARPPDPALVGERWRDMWHARLDETPLLVATWLAHQHRDAFWKHGSVCEDFSAIKAACLCVGGWGDAYSNTIPRTVEGLEAPAKAITGPWIHKYPHFAVPEPRIGFLGEAVEWWDRWLKGVENGTDALPAYRTYMLDAVRPATNYAERPGRWFASQAWPPEGARTQTLHLGPNGLTAEPQPPASLAVSSPQTTGLHGGEFCPIWLGPDQPGDQRVDDAGSAVFDTAPLEAGLAIAGAPTAVLMVASDQGNGFVVVRLCDVWPDGASTRISWGVLNLTHRVSHEHPRPCVPGEPMRVRVALDDIAYEVPAGHRLRLSVSTAYWPTIWPAGAPVTLTLTTQACTLSLAILEEDALPTPVFGPPQHAAPLEREELRPASNLRTIEEDQASGVTTLRIVDDFGSHRITSHGLATGEIARETWSIHPDDPLSARAETHWTDTLERGDWSVRTETFTTMTADATQFHIEARLEAYEEDGCVFTRTWSEAIARDLV